MASNFIAFEGISGSGKSVQRDLLSQWFKEQKTPLVIVDEPTAGEWGRKIIEFITSPALKGETAERIQLLFILDRKEDIERNIQPALKKGKIVLAERYFLSTLAYGEATGISWKRLWDLHKQLIGRDFPQPDITFLFDLEPLVAFERLQKMTKPMDYFETLERLRKAREAYLRISKHFSNIQIIDATQKAEVLHQQLLGYLKKQSY